MKSVFWLTVGVAVGFLVAHKVNETEGGRRFFGDLDAKTRDFAGAITEGYRAREAELRAAITDAEETIADLSAS